MAFTTDLHGALAASKSLECCSESRGMSPSGSRGPGQRATKMRDHQHNPDPNVNAARIVGQAAGATDALTADLGPSPI